MTVERKNLKSRCKRLADVLYKGGNLVVLKDGKVMNEVEYERRKLLEEKFCPFNIN